MAFRQLGLGRIVGNPTAAAVIATGSLPPDQRRRRSARRARWWSPTTRRSRTTTASTSRTYGVAAGRVGREHAEDELKRFDRELKAAIDEAMRMLKEGKYQYTTTGRRRLALAEPGAAGRACKLFSVPSKLLLVVIDAATPHVVCPAIQTGRLPVMRRLAEAGVDAHGVGQRSFRRSRRRRPPRSSRAPTPPSTGSPVRRGSTRRARRSPTTATTSGSSCREGLRRRSSTTSSSG